MKVGAEVSTATERRTFFLRTDCPFLDQVGEHPSECHLKAEAASVFRAWAVQVVRETAEINHIAASFRLAHIPVVGFQRVVGE